MKTLLLIILLCNNLFCIGQSEIIWERGPFLIDFEDTSENKFVLIDTNKIWEIGHPQKQILFIPDNKPYLGSKAIITDSIADYPNSVKSSFQVRLYFGTEVGTYGMAFEHKYDFENNKDGGIIETSYDNGVSWQNILLDTLIQNNLFHAENIYTFNDTIAVFNGQPGFTGTQEEMKRVVIDFYAKSWMINTPILMRFVLATDGQNASEGWMIDDLAFGGTSFVGATNYKNDLNIAHAFPNPTRDILNIKYESEDLKTIGILNSNGVLIGEYFGESINQINVSDFPPGIYFLVFTCQSDEKCISKFIKI